MSVEFKQFHAQIEPKIDDLGFELTVLVEIKAINSEEFDVKDVRVFVKDSDVNVYDQLSALDKKLIEAKAWAAPGKAVTKAFQDYAENKLERGV